MKLKQFLAGAVAAALVITSLPIPGLKSTQAKAAEEATNVALEAQLVAYPGAHQQGWSDAASLAKLTNDTAPTNNDDNEKWVSQANIKDGSTPIENAVSYLVFDLGEGSKTDLSSAEVLWFNGAYGTEFKLQTCDDYQAPENPNLMAGNTSGSITTADADYQNGSWKTVAEISRESATKDGFTVFDTLNASNGLLEDAKLGRYVRLLVTKMNPSAGYYGPAVRKIRLFGVPATDEPDVPVEPVYEDVEIRMGAAESQELVGESGSNGWAKSAVDGNRNTYWHSNWKNNNVDMASNANNSFFLALKEASSLGKVTYLPRTDLNGRILKCEIYVTTDELAGMPAVSSISDAATAESVNSTALGIFKAEGVNWDKVGDAEWGNTTEEKEFVFPSIKKDVTGVKITVKEAVSEQEGQQFISSAEFGVKAVKMAVDPDPIEPDPEVKWIKSGIKMGAAGSQELTGEAGGTQGWVNHMVDQDENTFWHSQWQGGNNVNIAEGRNNSYYIALDKAGSVDKITYLPRQNAQTDVNGTILKCEVYVTTDRLTGMPSLGDIKDANSCSVINNDAMNVFTSEKVSWKKVETSSFDDGNWADDDKLKEVIFNNTEKDVTGVQVKVTATGGTGNQNDKFISGAEFAVFAKEVPEEPEFVNETIKMGAAESQEMTGESGGRNGWAKYAVDGKNNTYWHSNWNQNDVDLSQNANNSYFIALDKAASVDKITYLPRQPEGAAAINGTILNCDVYVTTDDLTGMPSLKDITDQASATEKNNAAVNIFKADNITWKKVETSSFDNGNWANDEAQKEIVFNEKQKNVTGIKITAKATGAQSASQNNMFITCAEFGVIRRTIVDKTTQDAVNDMIDSITAAMDRVIASGNQSGEEQIYTTASYNRYQEAYEEAQRLGALTDLTGVTIADVEAAKNALISAYGRLLRVEDVKVVTGTPDVTITAPVAGAVPQDAELTGGTLETNADIIIERLDPPDEDGGISGKITAPTDRNNLFNITGTTKFLMHFGLKTGPVASTKTESVIGKMNEQYGLQIKGRTILLYGHLANGWAEVDYTIPDEEGWYDSWHDIVAIYNGNVFEIYVDGVAGVIPDDRKNATGALLDCPESQFSIFYNATGADGEGADPQTFNGKLRDISMYIGDNVPEYTIEEGASAEDVMNLFDTALADCEKDFELNAKAASQQTGYSIESTTWEPAVNAFERYQDYNVKVVVRADEGYEFAENATAVVRTGAANLLPADKVNVTASGDEMVITYTFKGETHPKVLLSEYINTDEGFKAIGWENKGEDNLRKYTAASWNTYLQACKAASAANGSSTLTPENYQSILADLRAAVAGLDLAAENCECELFDITGFSNETVALGMNAEKTITLGGEFESTNDCMVHKSAKPSVSYALVGSPAGAALTGKTLKVTQAGRVQVRMTVELGAQTKTATATYTVTSTRPTSEQTKALSDAMADALKYEADKDKYTAESWKAVEDALDIAAKLGQNAPADRVEAYTQAIRDAVNNLVIRDKKALEDLVSEISGLKEDDYTADSWSKVKTAYDSAEAVLKSSEASFDDYSKAYTELAAAKTALATKAAEVEAANGELLAAVTAAKAVYEAGQKNYTDATWKAFTDAYTAATAANANMDAAAVKTLASALKAAQAALAENAFTAGITRNVGKFTYKVKDAAAKTVILVKGIDKKQTTVTIPATVAIDGVSCKVVEIDKNAFKGYDKLTKVTIGKNVKKIGASAFKNCKKLKTVVIKGTAIKNVKNGAFAKTASKVNVKVPKKMNGKQRSALLKKLKNAGMK